MDMILLTSENFVREQTQISDNIQGKFLLPSIREAQEMYLQPIIGTALYKHMQELVENEDIVKPENEAYKSLIDIIQYFLTYKTMALLCVNSSIHVNNFGLNLPSDEHLQPLTVNQILQMENYWTLKADFYCKRVQEYCIENCNSLPELRENDTIDKMKSQMRSAASTSIWLGGKRSTKNNFLFKKKIR